MGVFIVTPPTNITRLVRVINFTRRVYTKVFLFHAYTPGAYNTPTTVQQTLKGLLCFVRGFCMLLQRE